MNGQIAPLDDDIWLGNFEACNAYNQSFDRIIHIWHVNQPGYCNHLTQNEKSLVVDYLEGSSLNKNILDDVWNFASQEGKMLVHCAAGLGRSPTLAILCKVARGCDFYKAVRDVMSGMWNFYAIKKAPNLLLNPMTDIMQYLEDAKKL